MAGGAATGLATVGVAVTVGTAAEVRAGGATDGSDVRGRGGAAGGDSLDTGATDGAGAEVAGASAVAGAGNAGATTGDATLLVTVVVTDAGRRAHVAMPALAAATATTPTPIITHPRGCALRRAASAEVVVPALVSTTGPVRAGTDGRRRTVWLAGTGRLERGGSETDGGANGAMAPANAATSGKRPPGSFVSARRTAAWTASGTLGTCLASGGGSSIATEAATAATVLPVKGDAPVRSS